MPRAAALLAPPRPGPDLRITDSLRRTIACLEGHGAADGVALRRLAFGIPPIDAHLGGGLSAHALHEFAVPPGDPGTGSSAATRVLATLLAPQARRRGPVLWVCARADLYPPGLAETGLDPSRLIVAEIAAARIPAAMEEALRHPGLSAVVGEIHTPLGLTLSRRLHLAAEKARRPAFLLHRRHLPAEPSAAVTRWRVGAVPSPPPQTRLAGLWLDPPRLHLDLFRCRDATPASWTIECHDPLFPAANRLALAAALADRPAAAPHAAPDRDQYRDRDRRRSA